MKEHGGQGHAKCFHCFLLGSFLHGLIDRRMGLLLPASSACGMLHTQVHFGRQVEDDFATMVCLWDDHHMRYLEFFRDGATFEQLRLHAYSYKSSFGLIRDVIPYEFHIVWGACACVRSCLAGHLDDFWLMTNFVHANWINGRSTWVSSHVAMACKKLNNGL